MPKSDEEVAESSHKGGDKGLKYLSDFDGNSNPDFWISQVERNTILYGWKTEEIVPLATLKFVGEMKRWYENGDYWNRKPAMTWDQFKVLVQQKCCKKIPRHVAMSKISKMKF